MVGIILVMVEVLEGVSLTELYLVLHKSINAKPEEGVSEHVADVEDVLGVEVVRSAHISVQDSVGQVPVGRSLLVDMFGEETERSKDRPDVRR